MVENNAGFIAAVNNEALERASDAGSIDEGSQRLLAAESDYIRSWRAARNNTEKEQEDSENLVGLALSGGGIRSATFALGIMQALANRGLLDKVDYLSTVSGGGYIGSAVSWMLGDKVRKAYSSDPECTGPPPRFGVTKQDFPFGSDDPAPGAPREDRAPQRKLLQYLRQHGYYLTPGAGITGFSLLGVVFRGTFLNLLVWLPAAILFFTFGLWAAQKTAAIMPLDVDQTPILSFTLNHLRPTGECAQPLPAATPVLPPTTDAACDALVAQNKFDQLLDHLPVLAGFEAFLWISGLLLVLLVAGTVLYSLATFFQQFFPRRMEPAWYGWRRRSETAAAVLLPVLLVTLIVGSLPLVAVYLQSWLVTVGPLAMLLGIGTVMRHFLASGESGRGAPKELAVTIGAALFLYGFILVAYMLAMSLFLSSPAAGNSLMLLLLLVVMLATGILVNLNHISIHRFYRDRLMEAFMPDLCFALHNRTGKAAKCADGTRLHELYPAEEPTGPYHIINTNLVLVNSQQRTYKQRGGDNFMLSAQYCGSNATGWCPTGDFMNGSMTLPTAVAISGAAANPNTGVGGVGLTRNLFLSLVMSLLNLRLGFWAVNPNRGKVRLAHWPNHFRPGAYAFGNAMGLWQLFPLLGINEKRTFVQLSDGGHFENTGVYELVRRRARLIIACDGSGDKAFSFADFQTTLRRIEDDFGARIKVIEPDTPDRVVPVPQEGHFYPKDAKYAEQGHMLGAITYADGSEGTLIYLKTTLVPQVSFKVKAYAAENGDFPDQSTADQFFDEPQFESYRELGYRLTAIMLDSPAPGRHKATQTVAPEDRLDAFIRSIGAS